MVMKPLFYAGLDVASRAFGAATESVAQTKKDARLRPLLVAPDFAGRS